MKAGILSIGSEIITGRTVDTNSSWLCSKLFKAGIPVRRIAACDDILDDIVACFCSLMSECDIVLATGGLGPTFDDFTRQGLSVAAVLECVENPIALSQVEEFFSRQNRLLSPFNRNQALMPLGSEVIKNNHGTAPGIHLSKEGREVFCLPGVPGEMKQMFEEYVLPRLCHVGKVQSTSFHVCGVAEAELAVALDQIVADQAVSRSINASYGIITLWLWGTGDNLREIFLLVEGELRNRFGSAIFGRDDDTMASVIGKLAVKHRVTIGTVESCTGGLAAGLITDIPGSSAYFRGAIVTYSNDIKNAIGVSPDLINRDGAVSELVAREMAIRGREWLGVDFAVSITGIAGPAGETETKKVGTVFAAVAGPDKCEVKARIFGGTRKLNRMFFANFALNNLRLAMLEQCK